MIYLVIYSKHMSSVIVIAAGNDITTGLADLWSLLRFPRLGPLVHLRLRQILCVMFHCKNNKTVCQRSPVQEAGRSGEGVCYWRPLCESGRPALLTPPSLRSESGPVRSPGSRTSLMSADLRGCFTYRTYGGRREGGEWGLSHGALDNLYLVRILRVLLYIQKGKDQIHKAKNLKFI